MIKSNSKELFTTHITNGKHDILADEPLSLGGKDQGMTPSELLEGALAACTSITLQMYTERKGWELDEIQVEIEEIDDTNLLKRIQITGEFSEDQLKRMKVISNKCPVHKVLEKHYSIESEIKIVEI